MDESNIKLLKRSIKMLEKVEEELEHIGILMEQLADSVNLAKGNGHD